MEAGKPGAGGGPQSPYRFADIVVDPAAHSLLCAGVEQPIEPKAFSVLLELLQRPGQLVPRDDLLDRVWGTQHVTPGVLTRVIAQLRHALRDDPQNPRFIQTRHALGYCFIGKLEYASATPDTGEPLSQPASVNEPHQPDHTDPPRSNADESAESVWQGHAKATGKPWSRTHLWLATLVLALVVVLWQPLRRWQAPPSASEASIAILPFRSLNSTQGTDYFTAGLEEEMRSALAGVAGLRVAANRASAELGALDPKAIGAKLGVDNLLEVSVRHEAKRLRIDARLADTRSGFTRWSKTYDRDLTGVFATQTEIAQEVVQALLGVIPGQSESLQRRLTPTQSASAFDAYLRGLQALRETDQPGNAEVASTQFENALAADRGFALAQAGLCRSELWRYQTSRNVDSFQRAQSACSRAAQMDPTLAEVELALGDLYRIADDPTKALAHYRASANAISTRVDAHIGMARVLSAQGQRDAALKEFDKALQFGQDDARVYAHIGYQHYLDGQFDAAIHAYRKATELDPGDAVNWGTLGALYQESGHDAEAMHALETAIAIQPDAGTLSNLGLLKYEAGDYPAAVALQRRALALDSRDFMVWGNLGEALQADPAATALEVREAFSRAANNAQAFLGTQPDDARALAALGYYRVVLGDLDEARRLVTRSSALGTQAGEVALLNAETLALLGDLSAAKDQLALARKAGISESILMSNLTFKRLGLVPESSPPATHPSASAPASSQGLHPGE